MTTDRIILLVEDNPDDEALTLRALRKHKVANEVHVERNGADALAFLLGEAGADHAPGPLPALVLLDLKLPKLDGVEVLRRLRGDPRTRRVPVVVLTSSAEERDRAETYDLGVNSYIRKPVDFEQFSEAVRQIGLYWLVLNELPPPTRDG
jgi:two-component system response regulator